MCGLAGIFAYADHAALVDQAELLRLRDQMLARGPDGAGLWQSPDQRVGLAHRRLAIIDLSPDGVQPMASGDGRYQIVFNGEIYNYRELRTSLIRRGAVFRTQSDTEVLLQLYAAEGPAMCRQLRGMYAFAIWDSVEQSLFLARDPFGIKPMYVHDDGKTLRFASQVKAMLAGGAVERQPDVEGEHSYWIWGHVTEPHTPYRNVCAFDPGCWLKIGRHGKTEDGRFDSVADMLAGNTPPSNPYPDLRAALLDSVRHHLIADVPVGVFLSAGIDSATLAALAAECGGTLRTVTLGFEEYRGTAADETMLAEQVAHQYGAEHQTVWISRKDFEHAFDEFLQAMDQPSIDGLNTWLVSRAAAQVGLKVAISGLGGDEFFGGYPSFRQLPLMRQLARPFTNMPGLGRILRRLSAPLLRCLTSEKYAGLLEYGHSWQGAYMLRRAMRMPWELTHHFHGNAAEQNLPGLEHPRSMISYLESTRYMRNQLLRDSDWASMAHSIELRVPLVDVELTRYIAQQRQAGQVFSKQDLAATARPALPEPLVNRPKTGFTVPVRDWMRPAGKADLSTQERGLHGWQRKMWQAYQNNTPSLSHSDNENPRPNN